MVEKNILQKAKDIALGKDKPPVTQLPDNPIDHLEYENGSIKAPIYNRKRKSKDKP